MSNNAVGSTPGKTLHEVDASTILDPEVEPENRPTWCQLTSMPPPRDAIQGPTSANHFASLLSARSFRRRPSGTWTSGCTLASQQMVVLVNVHPFAGNHFASSLYPSLCQWLVQLPQISRIYSSLLAWLHPRPFLSMCLTLRRPRAGLLSSPWIHPDLYLKLPQSPHQDVLLMPQRPRISFEPLVVLQLQNLFLLLILVSLLHVLSEDVLKLAQAIHSGSVLLCHWCLANSFFEWKQRPFPAQVLTRCQAWSNIPWFQAIWFISHSDTTLFKFHVNLPFQVNGGAVELTILLHAGLHLSPRLYFDSCSLILPFLFCPFINERLLTMRNLTW